MLRFFLFGAPRFERDGEPIVISRRKAIALLAYLAVTRQAHSRDALATLFWPEHDQSSARANLRRDLSNLKQVLGDEVLLVDALQVGLDAQADVWLDVDRFRVCLAHAQHHHHPSDQLCVDCLEALTEAAALYSADFMEGFSLPDSAGFDEWQFFQAEGLRQLLAEALRQLGEWHAVRGEFERGIEHSRRWSALDPLHEPAHRQLMRLYAWSGQQAAALRQYQECMRLLEEQLDAPPDEETTALYETIRTRQLTPPPTTLGERATLTALADMPLHERYVCEQLLMVGGHGEVYLGRDRVAGEPVVIKRLKPELTLQNATLVARFTREGELLRQLKHPNIVTMLEAFEQEGEHHIVMEYAPGGTLRDVLDKEKQLPVARTLDIALELADALSRAHHLGIIHRDLKPENVLLAADGTPRLTDFGLARLQRTEARLTQTGTVIGSPIYMGPEALRGEELDPRSDIWSFGVLLFELLTGRYPFDGKNIAAMLAGILEAPLPDITLIRPDVSTALADLLSHMLTKDREQRISSMRMVAAELEALRSGRHGSSVIERRTPTVSHPTPVQRLSPPTPEPQQHVQFCHSKDGVRIAYATIGQGPVLIKAANWLSHLEFDRVSPIWQHWLTGLSAQHTLIRYDERGCGLSDWDVADMSFETWVSDLEAVVDASGVDRFALLGISQGGPIAMAYTARHPERVSHLILYGTYARGKKLRDPSPQKLEEIEALNKLIRIGWGQENPAFRQVFTSLFIPDGTPEQYRWFNELQRVSATPENAARIVSGFNMIDVRDIAPQIHTPALVLHARGDARIPFEEGQLVAALLPHARFVALESRNHILMAHEPAWQKFLSEVHAFLESDASRARHTQQPSPHMVRHHNLPMPATSFVGRDSELAEVRQMFIADPACRLLTLVGPGGVGKTRLAIALAGAQHDAFADGVWFVPFALVDSPDLLIFTIADALGLTLAGQNDPKEQFLDFVRNKEMLLVLDNLEHLIAGVDVLGDILEASPLIKILVTSRERLNLHAEQAFDLRGLSLPEQANGDTEHSDAIRLFVQSALRSRRDFMLDATNLEAVAHICRLVGGVPLAIELAASWLRTLSPAEIANEIEKGIDFLQSSIRDLPARHQSMRAVFDYSWNLLSEDEQIILRRLSVFRKGFRREVATEVVDATLPMLITLVDKSLLSIDAGGRYRRHPMVRQYAREKLAEHPEEQAQTFEKHGIYYIGFLKTWGKELRGGRQKEALAAIEEEIENIHAAWRWAISEKRIDALQPSWDPVDEFYIQCNRVCEGTEVFDQIARGLDEANPDHHALLGRILLSQANLNFRLEHYEVVVELAQRGLRLLKLSDDPHGVMKGLNLLGITVMRRGQYAQSRAYIEEAIALARASGERGRLVNYLNNLGILEMELGNAAVAEQLYQDALAVNRELGNHLSIVRNLTNLGEVYLVMDRLQEAESLFREGLEMAREMGFAQVVPHLLGNLGAVMVEHGDFEQAREFLEESLRQARELGALTLQADTLRRLGEMAAAQGDDVQAHNWFAQSLKAARSVRHVPHMLRTLSALAEMWIRQERLQDVAQILQVVLQHPSAEDRAQRLLEELRDRSSVEFEESGTMDLNDLVDMILKA